MLKSYIAKVVCLATLCAFLLQPQWFEAFSVSKTQQNQQLNISKTTKLSSYVYDQVDENESDDNSEVLFSVITVQPKIVTASFPGNNTSSPAWHKKDLHRLQERPIWLISRKIIL